MEVIWELILFSAGVLRSHLAFWHPTLGNGMPRLGITGGFQKNTSLTRGCRLSVIAAQIYFSYQESKLINLSNLDKNYSVTQDYRAYLYHLGQNTARNTAQQLEKIRRKLILHLIKRCSTNYYLVYSNLSYLHNHI